MSDDLDPMAQAEVEAEIRRLVRELADQTKDNAEAGEKAASDDVAFDLAYARAILAAPKIHHGEKVTVAEREAMALLSVEDYHQARRLSEAVHKATQERGRNLRASIDALRTIAANVRGAVQHGY